MSSFSAPAATVSRALQKKETTDNRTEGNALLICFGQGPVHGTRILIDTCGGADFTEESGAIGP